jgi:hypothetical protein
MQDIVLFWPLECQNRTRLKLISTRLAGFAAFGASSYGVYEWRQEVLQYFRRFTAKLPFISAK